MIVQVTMIVIVFNTSKATLIMVVWHVSCYISLFVYLLIHSAAVSSMRVKHAAKYYQQLYGNDSDITLSQQITGVACLWP